MRSISIFRFPVFDVVVKLFIPKQHTHTQKSNLMLVLIIARNTLDVKQLELLAKKQNYQNFVSKRTNFSLQSVRGNWFLQLLDLSISNRSIKTIDILRYQYAKVANKFTLQFFLFLSLFIKRTPIGCIEFLKFIFLINLHIRGHNYCHYHIRFKWIRFCISYSIGCYGNLFSTDLDSQHLHSSLLVVNGKFAT